LRDRASESPASCRYQRKDEIQSHHADELKQAHRKVRHAQFAHVSSIGVGAIAAGLLAGYATNGLSGAKHFLFREIVIVGAIGAFLCGHAASHAVRRSVKELESIRAQTLELMETNRQQGAVSNGPVFVDELTKRSGLLGMTKRADCRCSMA
jgi:hypothetical protein